MWRKASRGIKRKRVEAFRYKNSKTPNRICIAHEEKLPDYVDVYTDDYGGSEVAMRYVPERTNCPKCGERMCH